MTQLTIHFVNCGGLDNAKLRKVGCGLGSEVVLRGRYGVAWMLFGWALIVMLIGGGIFIVANLSHFIPG